MSDREQKVAVSVDMFNTLTNYLMERPYREVNKLLDELRQEAAIIELPEEVVAEDE